MGENYYRKIIMKIITFFNKQYNEADYDIKIKAPAFDERQ